jgi:hypothetical protein
LSNPRAGRVGLQGILSFVKAPIVKCQVSKFTIE